MSDALIIPHCTKCNMPHAAKLDEPHHAVCKARIGSAEDKALCGARATVNAVVAKEGERRHERKPIRYRHNMTELAKAAAMRKEVTEHEGNS